MLRLLHSGSGPPCFDHGFLQRFLGVDAPDSVEVQDCHCSICGKAGHLYLVRLKQCFQLLQGAEHLHVYSFGMGIAQHYFCAHCGVRPYYIPRSNPDGVDVNLRCLDTRPPRVRVVAFDGQNWERNAAHLAEKSRP